MRKIEIDVENIIKKGSEFFMMDNWELSVRFK